MPRAATKSSRLSVFVTILSLFAIVVLLTGTAITVANYIQTRQTALSVASAALDATIRRINEGRLAFFIPVNLFVALYSNDPRVTNSSEQVDAILMPVLNGLRRTPQVSGVYVGYENGDYYQILSFSPRDKETVTALGGPPGARYAVQTIRSDGAGARTETWRFLDDAQQDMAVLSNASPVYDPRARGWYREAKAQSGAFVRTAPYVFAATPQVGLTIGTSFDGPVGGVVAADVTLDRLSDFLQELRTNPRHRVLTFDENGGLIASPDPDQVLKRTGSGSDLLLEPAKITDIQDPVVQAVARHFGETGAFELKSIDINGEEFLASVVRQTEEDRRTGHYILYAAPRADFEGTLAGAATRSIIPAVLIFLLVSPAIVYMARLISRPLTDLSKEAAVIQSFSLDDPIAMTSLVREIDALIGAMSGMKSTLREISKFVPKAHVRSILESGRKVAVGGEKRTLSLLFTDVKDFTPISDNTPPERLMVTMSEYFEELVSLIIQEGGTVDKFVGDAIFAYWNAPLPTDRHEHAACVAAMRCRNASVRLNARWVAAGREPWHTRFGVHAGDTVVGNVGSSDRIDYTVIGSAVNIASRLEGLNKQYGTQVLASGQIVDACAGEFLFRHLDRSLPKGAIHPLDIYEVLGMYDGPAELCITPDQAKLVVDWNIACEAYAGRNWFLALDAMEAFVRLYPEDGVARIYLERIIEFLIEPPPDDWDGTIRFSQK